MNLKKNILAISWLLFLGCITFFATYYISLEPPPEAPPTVPSVILATNNNTNDYLKDTLNLKDLQQDMVIILFSTSCAYSKKQANYIRGSINEFKNYEIYFISYDNFINIERFATQSNLNNFANVHFLQAPIRALLPFNYYSSPSIYIYSHNGRLRKNWVGETSVTTIKKYM